MTERAKAATQQPLATPPLVQEPCSSTDLPSTQPRHPHLHLKSDTERQSTERQQGTEHKVGTEHKEGIEHKEGVETEVESTTKQEQAQEHERKQHELNEFALQLRSMQNKLQEVSDSFTSRLEHVRTGLTEDLTNVRARAHKSQTLLDSELDSLTSKLENLSTQTQTDLHCELSALLESAKRIENAASFQFHSGKAFDPSVALAERMKAGIVAIGDTLGEKLHHIRQEYYAAATTGASSTSSEHTKTGTSPAEQGKTATQSGPTASPTPSS